MPGVVITAGSDVTMPVQLSNDGAAAAGAGRRGADSATQAITANRIRVMRGSPEGARHRRASGASLTASVPGFQGDVLPPALWQTDMMLVPGPEVVLPETVVVPDVQVTGVAADTVRVR